MAVLKNTDFSPAVSLQSASLVLHEDKGNQPLKVALMYPIAFRQ